MIYTIANLENKVGSEFVDAFRGIPKNKVILEVINGNLGAKNIDHIIEGLKLIPQSIQKIDFRGNQLSNLSEVALVKLVENIPDTVTAIGLGDNGLNRKAGMVLSKLLSTLKPNITVVDLSNNKLSIKPHDRTTSTCDISKAVKTQKNRNSAGDTTQRARGSAGSTTLFRGESQIFTLPGAIDDDRISLPTKVAASLEKAFKSMSRSLLLPSNVKALDLSFNMFYLLPGALLARVFLSFPQSITSLSFRGNGLGINHENVKDFSQKRKDELVIAFKGLKDKNITLLDISGNELDNLLPKDLLEVIFSLPPQTTDIILSAKDIEKFTDDDLVILSKHLRLHDKVLKLKNERGLITSVIRKPTIVDPDLIPGMFFENRKTPYTSGEVNLHAAAIHYQTIKLMRDFGYTLYHCILEYLNITLQETPIVSLNPNTLSVTTRGSPSPSPLGTPSTMAISANGASGSLVIIPSPTGAAAAKEKSKSALGGDASGAAAAAAVTGRVGSATKYLPKANTLFPPAKSTTDGAGSAPKSQNWCCWS